MIAPRLAPTTTLAEIIMRFFPIRFDRRCLLPLLLIPFVSAPASAQIAKHPIFDGVAYQRMVRTDTAGKPMVVHVVTLDLRRPGVKLTVSPGDHAGGMEYVAHGVRSILIARHAQVAVNGSYFLPFFGGSPAGDDYYPHAGEPASVSGAAIANGHRVSPVEIDQDLRVSAILCIGRRVSIQAGQRCPSGTRDAIAAGPHLLRAGKDVPIHRALLADGGKGPRTAFGLSADGLRAWILVIDGRQPGYSMGADNSTLVALFRELGATDAMSFDGGGSSTLAIADDKGAAVLNRPIHTGVPGRERPVANALLVYARPVDRDTGGGGVTGADVSGPEVIGHSPASAPDAPSPSP